MSLHDLNVFYTITSRFTRFAFDLHDLASIHMIASINFFKQSCYG